MADPSLTYWDYKTKKKEVANRMTNKHKFSPILERRIFAWRRGSTVLDLGYFAKMLPVKPNSLE